MAYGIENKLVFAVTGEQEPVRVGGLEQSESKNTVSLIKSGEHAGTHGTEKVTAKGTGKFQTVGRELSVDEYLKRLDKADEMYESFRQSKTDVSSIAKNTGMSEQRVQRIKEHLLSFRKL